MRAIPPAFKHIQVNGCKTPGCKNFGVPPREGPIQIGRGGSSDGYVIVKTGSTTIICKECDVSTKLKSNKAIFEEFVRQGGKIWDVSGLRCPHAACANSNLANAETRLRKFGVTKSGSPRFQCSACNKTFSVGMPTLRQRLPHKNTLVFELLLNKSPLNRICEVADITFDTLYRKIDFIYEQCLAFSADRERRLASMQFKRLYLCTDRQDHLVNWHNRSKRKTIQLTAVATADLDSGYVFGLTPNFDPSITQDDLEAQWLAAGDGTKPAPMRETARLWTMADYQESADRNALRFPSAHEPDENISADQQLPPSGCQIHADYLTYGHYWLLRHHFQGADKLRFFLDQDAGLLSACLGAYSDRINSRTADIAIICIDKELTVDARNAAFAKAKAWLSTERKRFPALSDREARTAIMAEILAAARTEAPANILNDLMIGIPFPDLAEPNKRVRFVTDYTDYDDQHLANLLLKATLWPVDTTFNQIRRRLTLCERPITSKRRTGRLWHIYAPYNPMVLTKALTIFRTWQNYVWVAKKTKTTAAQKIGLAQGKIRISDILSYSQSYK